jgi:ech hydrogenase subunit B
VLAPLVGGLLTGWDRKISARMQGRVGPPLLQPFYDVVKLLTKEAAAVNTVTRYYITIYLCFTIFTTTVFVLGYDILIAVFALTLASVFFVVAAYSTWSPYSLVGAERELLQIMAYEPMILLVAFGYYYVTKSFAVGAVFSMKKPIILQLPLIFIGLIYVLGFKLRKSPFDLSTSHHGHQEIVKGITTELNSICLAMVEIAHWYETVFALGFVFLFFAADSLLFIILAAVICFVIYFFEILTDNAFARVKWEAALKVSWIVSAVAGIVNLYALQYWGSFS